jgi:serine/threonine protein kinase
MKLLRYGCAIERLGQRYRLEGALGSGGMADVCLAWDEREEREVAIKIVKTDELDQETLNRFLKEASQVVRWDHLHILRIYDDVKWELLNTVHGSMVPYIVMEYAKGGDLQERLTSGQPYPFAETLSIFAQLCSAVQYAHEHNVIHRDLKPLNILFRRLADGSEQVVLSDFGLAVQVDATHHTFAHGGTLAYMAPEQFQGKAKPASDIFALGVILYQLSTGKLPFRRSLQDFGRADPLEIPPRPSTLNEALPKALDDVILTAMRPWCCRR